MCVWPYVLLACFQFQVFSNSGKPILYLAIKDNWVIGRCWGLGDLSCFPLVCRQSYWFVSHICPDSPTHIH